MMEDLVNVICSWIYSLGNRYLVEVAIIVVCFGLIHFIGYPFVIRRHDAQVQQERPSIKTGDIVTYGDNSPVFLGTEPQKNKAGTDAKTHK
jgi:hypothetical protein